MQEQSTHEHDVMNARGSVGRKVIVAGLSLAVLFVSVIATFWLLNTVPRSRRRKPRQYSTLVEVISAQKSQKQVVLDAMGTVQAAQQVTLFPRVRGEIVWLNRGLLPGGFYRRRQRLLRIDPADYRLLVSQASSALARAKAALALEIGQQKIAQKEYKMLNKGVSKANLQLMLRKPQLDTAKANVRAAKASLAQARLNLRRTTIRAPFDALIAQRLVNLGTRVTENTSLLQIVGTNAFWVELALAVDDLKWLRIPRKRGEKGSKVRVYLPGRETLFREGEVIRLYPGVESQGRMARLLVEIKDPLARKAANKGQPRLLLGTYVKAQIFGKTAPSSFVVSRRFLRDNDTVWLMTDDNKLSIRKVDVMFRGADSVIIRGGLQVGDKIVTTLLPTPVNGMSLRTAGSRKGKKAGRRGGRG
tara:strand:- start:5615 stop:6865 length:1251 start_codon:yes stop_codon:yes gene_type:complete